MKSERPKGIMKTVLITGGGKGVGKGFAQYFLAQDSKVFIGIRDPKKVSEDLKNKPNLIAVKMDVSNDESIKQAFKEIDEQTSHLDYLINNAGLNSSSATDGKKDLVCSLTLLDRVSLLKIFDVNSVSPMIILKEFLPLLNGDPSYVINISSDKASYQDEYPNTNGNYGYRASKTALNMFTFCSLFDLPKNIKTFAVHPGGVKTDMNPNGEHDSLVQAEKIINITKNWREEFNGRFLRFDGTFYPL